MLFYILVPWKFLSPKKRIDIIYIVNSSYTNLLHLKKELSINSKCMNFFFGTSMLLRTYTNLLLASM